MSVCVFLRARRGVGVAERRGEMMGLEVKDGKKQREKRGWSCGGGRAR